jgi:hypothetical protein
LKLFEGASNRQKDEQVALIQMIHELKGLRATMSPYDHHPAPLNAFNLITMLILATINKNG